MFQSCISPRPRTLLALLAVLALWPGTDAAGQAPPTPETRVNTRRAQASRAELEANLLQIDSILTSSGYSSRIRDAKRREQLLIRQRLTDGDLQVGDLLQLTVLGEPTLTGTFPVSAGQTLSLPGLPDIALRGVLRSEAEEHLTVQLRRYLRDPSIQVQTSIRLSILGAVGKPGFYQIPADVLISEAIMLAGGPAGGSDPNRTTVKRSGRVLLSEEDIRDALVRGVTLDQLNLRAGDEFVVDIKRVRGGSVMSVLTILGTLASITWMLRTVF